MFVYLFSYLNLYLHIQTWKCKGDLTAVVEGNVSDNKFLHHIWLYMTCNIVHKLYYCWTMHVVRLLILSSLRVWQPLYTFKWASWTLWTFLWCYTEERNLCRFGTTKDDKTLISEWNTPLFSQWSCGFHLSEFLESYVDFAASL